MSEELLQQAIDYRDECDALSALLEGLDDQALRQTTGFRRWTINDVIAHLYLFDRAADLTLTDERAFATLWGELATALGKGATLRDFAEQWLAGVEGAELVARWRGFYPELAGRYAAAEPKRRLKWAGPDMSVRSSITARHMETWAHGLAVYDLLGVGRLDTGRIRNIVILGVNTFGWTYANRGLKVPAAMPGLSLAAPSGEIWDWPTPDDGSHIRGTATAFCQVVTQTRNVSDTELDVVGETARQWMAMAQCFAGPPAVPPAPGTRGPRRPADA